MSHIVMITSLQKEILNGLMLGDGHLELHKRGKNPALKIKRVITDIEYLKYHAQIFDDILTKANIRYGGYFDKRTSKTYEYCALSTRCLPDLLPYHHIWYVNGKKIIPHDLILTPLTIATWIADDGSIYIGKDKKGNIHPETLTLKLATDGFTKQDTLLLKEKLEVKYDFEWKIYQHKTGQYTLHSTKSDNTKKILKDINEHFPPGMERKSNLWRSPKAKLNYVKNYPPCKWCGGTNIYSKGFTASKKRNYYCCDCNRHYIFPYY